MHIKDNNQPDTAPFNSQTPIFVGEALNGVTLRNRIALAPMSGVSDLPFRQLAYEYGAGWVVTEMVASRELVCDSKESYMRLQGDGITPHIVQLAGREAYWMAEAAKICVDHGADMIDINMGCPAKKVTGGYSGSALMRDLDLAVSLIQATVDAVNVPVSVKMRLGWDEHSLNAPELAKRAEDCGAKMITVHGRTRSQFYNGHANWDAIAQVKDAISLPLIANGDVETQQDIETIIKKSGADAVMIGRACQGQPWLCGQLAGHQNVPSTQSEILEFIIRHYAMMIAHYGEKIGVRQSRKHLNWYLERFAANTATELRHEILSLLDPVKVIEKMNIAMLDPNNIKQEVAA